METTRRGFFGALAAAFTAVTAKPKPAGAVPLPLPTPVGPTVEPILSCDPVQEMFQPVAAEGVLLHIEVKPGVWEKVEVEQVVYDTAICLVDVTWNTPHYYWEEVKSRRGHVIRKRRERRPSGFKEYMPGSKESWLRFIAAYDSSRDSVIQFLHSKAYSGGDVSARLSAPGFKAYGTLQLRQFSPFAVDGQGMRCEVEARGVGEWKFS